VIITRPRDWQRIRDNLESVGAKKVFIVGCGSCATQSETGGEPQVLDTKSRLEMAGYEVVGYAIGEVACHDNATARELRKSHGDPDDADAMLVLACGAGTQSVAEARRRTPTFPGLESVFLGNVVRHGVFEERCSMCGECVLDRTAGICPVTTCPKGLLNGPCGAMWEGRCDVTGDGRQCVFVRIHERLEEQGRGPAPGTLPPKDHARKSKAAVLDTRAKDGSGDTDDAGRSGR
jgi:ferredoxin